MPTYDRELSVAVSAATEAAAAILERYRRSDTEVRYKTPIEPVTEADMVADRILRSRLTAAFPEDAWLSEESQDDGARHRCERVWIVDPLDGTREFLAGRPEFTVSVALVTDRRPVVGVIVNPVSHQVWSAQRGAGATRDGQPIQVSETSSLEKAVVLVSRTESAAGMLVAHEERMQLRLAGGMANKLVLLAQGDADATFTTQKRCEWDAAAGSLILEEAGGIVTGLDGARLDFNQVEPWYLGVVASNGRIQDPLRAQLS